MTKAVIFDVDGTLVDAVDHNAYAWQEAFRDHGYEVAFADIRGQIGKGDDQLMPVFLTADDMEAHGKALEAHQGRIFRERYLVDIAAFPRVRELIERLRADGKRIVLASSAKADDVEVFKKIAGITDLIEAEATSDDAERSKPHPDIFLAVL